MGAARERQEARSACDAGDCRVRCDLTRFAGRLRLDVAGYLAAALDLDLAVANRPRNPPGRLDQQPLADSEIALEAAAHFRLLDCGGALEQAALGDVDVAAVGQIGLDAALDEQLVARIDLARERDLAADAEPAHFAVRLGLVGQIHRPAQRIARAGRIAGPRQIRRARRHSRRPDWGGYGRSGRPGRL